MPQIFISIILLKIATYRTVSFQRFIDWPHRIIGHIFHVPLETLTFQFLSQCNSITDIARVNIFQFRFLVVKPFFVLIHPHLRNTLEVYKRRVSFGIGIRDMMPIDVSHARTGYIFQLATTLPQLQKDVVHNFCDLHMTDPGTLPSKQAPFNHPRNRPFPVPVSVSIKAHLSAQVLVHGNWF